MKQLRDYQKLAVDHLRRHDKAALFLDMGLGKTAVTLSALEPRHLPALVFAPKRVAENVWDEERDLWRPDLSIAVAKGNPSQRSKALQAGADITVIGRDNQADVFKVKPVQPWKTLIIDELSGYKSRQSVRWKLANRLVNLKNSKVEHVWGLTGTPAPESLLDLWAQVYLLDKGERFGSLTKYRSRFFRPGRQLPSGVITEWKIVDGMKEKIYSLIEDICLSMSTEGRVELPPLLENEVRVTLPPKAMKAYQEMHSTLVTTVDITGMSAMFSAVNSAVMTSKLQQISGGFILSDEYALNGEATWLHQEKINAVKEIVEETGSPVLVFYHFREELKALRKAIPQAHTINEKDIVKRWNRGEVPVLLAHPQSAGHGLNLQHGGHTVVWSTLTWAEEVWEQANKRVFRSGQQHPVVIHVVTAVTPRGGRTVDHLCRTRLENKGLAQADLLDFLEAPL